MVVLVGQYHGALPDAPNHVELAHKHPIGCYARLLRYLHDESQDGSQSELLAILGADPLGLLPPAQAPLSGADGPLSEDQ